MMTVVDHLSPWLTPRSALVKSTEDQTCEVRLVCGECKFQTSAGHAVGDLKNDLVPGSADQSVLVHVHRVAYTDPTGEDPAAARLVDQQGVQLMRDWIASMTPRSCD